MAFRDGRMGVDQILSVRNDDAGHAGMPATRTW
jgi:cyclopropane-fatty-acyl-phospholipid synthase